MNNNFFKNSFYNAFSGLIRIGLGMLTIPLLIRIIGIQEYGLWTIVSAAAGLLILVEAGLATTTTIFISQDLAKKDSQGLSYTLTATFGAILILATLAFVVLQIGAASIVNSFPKLSTEQYLIAKQALQISSIVVSARLIQEVIIGIEQAYEKYNLINFLRNIQSVLSSIGLLLVALLGGRTILMMQYQAIVSVILLIFHVFLVWFLVRDFKPRIAWSNNKSLAIARYSTSTWLANLGGVIFSQVDRLVVGGMLGTNVLGVYAAITGITSQINILSALPVQPLLPALSRWMTSQESSLSEDMIQQNIRKALEINCLVALGIGTILLGFTPVILSFTLKTTLSENYILAFRLATFIYSLYSLNAVGYYVCFGANMIHIAILGQILSGVVSIGLIFMGINLLGLMGAIIGNIGYFGIYFLSFFAFGKLGIRASLWIYWILFPIIGFFLMCSIICIISLPGMLNILISSLYLIVLITWFIVNNIEIFKQFVLKIIIRG